MIPTLAVLTRDLLKDDRAAEVALPRVYMQIKDWWKGGKCQVSLHFVTLRGVG
jgi:mediator of RNA polymerase II transcription subunit 14